jgi:hypothetical protein
MIKLQDKTKNEPKNDLFLSCQLPDAKGWNNLLTNNGQNNF